MGENYRLLSLVGILLLCFGAGLAGSPVWGQAKEAAGGLTIQGPDSGPVTQRVKELWQTTRPIITADSQANRSEAQYQARRTALFSAWVKLQAAPGGSDEVGRLIPRILELIDQVYGFPGYPEAKRMEKRQNVGRTKYLLKEIDRRVGKLS